jgi:two-component system, cell cycle response regulator
VSLRARLTLYFVIIVVLPVTAVTAYGWHAVARSTQRQVRTELALARGEATAAFGVRMERAHEAVAALARDPALLQALAAQDGRGVRAVLRRQGVTDLLLAVTAPDARVLGRAGNIIPGFLPGVARAPLGMLLAPNARVRSRPMLQRVSADLRQRGCTPAGSRRCLLGTVTAGVWMDSQELQRLARGALDADLTLLVGDTPVASTIGRLGAGERVSAVGGAPRRGRLAGRPVVMAVEPLTNNVGEQARLLVSIPATPTTAGIDSRLLAIVLLGLAVVCLVATLLGSVLARLVSRPLGELAAQARAIARGDFASPPSGVRSGGEVGDLDLPPSILRSRGELGELARAFERMRVELGEYLSALRTSRDELARSMNRLGETLSSTHDLPKLLTVVMEAAVQARRAKAGSLLLLTPDRTALVRQASHGLSRREPAERVPVGQGVAGTVAATGRAMVLASPAGNGHEPHATSQVSVPLLVQGKVLGVLSLYDREDGEPFTLADAESLTAFAVQAAVAIENVQLHAEAERLSVTDPLTGAWNYRYFSRRFEQEIERSRRFRRVLALLMLDIDHFKSVNDRFGHQRGDEVLVEFARRVTGSVRDIDTFARYGGEEFVLILPETNLEGGLAVAEKLRVGTHKAPFCSDRSDDSGVRLTVSIGVACFPEHATQPEELLRAADEALYEAKLQGRDRVVTAGPRLQPLAARPGQVKGRAARVE